MENRPTRKWMYIIQTIEKCQNTPAEEIFYSITVKLPYPKGFTDNNNKKCALILS